jgi:N-methylhydantoinase B
MIDSGGPGRWRGGTGGELAITPHKAPDGGINYVISGKGARHPMSEGLSGGYPGAPNAYIWIKQGDRRVPLFAGSLDEMGGEQERIAFGVFPLMGADICYIRWNGGGGYGDPLLREPERVQDDIAAGRVGRDAGAAIYGVVIDEGGDVDVSATDVARARIRTARLAGPAQEAAE